MRTGEVQSPVEAWALACCDAKRSHSHSSLSFSDKFILGSQGILPSWRLAAPGMPLASVHPVLYVWNALCSLCPAWQMPHYLLPQWLAKGRDTVLFTKFVCSECLQITTRLHPISTTPDQPGFPAAHSWNRNDTGHEHLPCLLETDLWSWSGSPTTAGAVWLQCSLSVLQFEDHFLSCDSICLPQRCHAAQNIGSAWGVGSEDELLLYSLSFHLWKNGDNCFYFRMAEKMEWDA